MEIDDYYKSLKGNKKCLITYSIYAPIKINLNIGIDTEGVDRKRFNISKITECKSHDSNLGPQKTEKEIEENRSFSSNYIVSDILGM